MKKKPSKSKTLPTRLDQQLEQLKQLGPEELLKRWQTVLGSNPPAKTRSSLMIQVLARHLQGKGLWRSQTLHAATAAEGC